MSYAREGTRSSSGAVSKRELYACRYKHCTARDMQALDRYVTLIDVERLSRPDAAWAFADGAQLQGASSARAEAAELARRLEAAALGFSEGRLSSTLLSMVEAELRPRIDAANKAAQVAGLPEAAHDVAQAEDPASRWAELSTDRQRAVVRALMEVVVLPVAVKGRRSFDPECVRIDWRADASQ